MNERIEMSKLVEDARPLGEEAPPADVRPASRRKRRLALLGALALAGVAGFGFRYWTHGRFIVSTDNAYVKADTAQIASKVSGYIDSVAVVDNQKVKAGDVLARIDPRDYELAAEAARLRVATQDATIDRIGRQRDAADAQVAQAKAQLLASEADRVRAASEFERQQSLVNQKFGTPQRLDQARADRDRTHAAAVGAQAAVLSAERARDVLGAQQDEARRQRAEMLVAQERAERDLVFTQVRAPFDATVGARIAQPGQFVTAGTRLMALVPLSSAYIEANFKETQLGGLKPGQTAEVSVDAYDKCRLTGVVESLAPASGAQFSLLPPENATGNFTKIVQRFPVRVRAPLEADCLLRAGMSVVVDVDVRTGAR